MNQPITFQGRSFLFNALFVLFNLIGLTLVVIGFHKNFEENRLILSLSGVALIGITTAGLLIFHGRIMMAGVSRVLVGGLCIVSGLVKANDPVGFAYKLEEYFEDGALAYRIKELFGMPSFSLEFLIPFALVLSVLICLSEIVFGVMLIIGGRIKFISYMVLIMMLFFTFLTWHTANCDSEKKFVDRDTYELSNPMALLKIEEAKTNKNVKIIHKTAEYLVVDEKKSPQCVTDCGCFGDALKGSVGRSLTPDESLWKDLILLYLVLWIFMTQWIIKPNTRKQNLIFSLSSLVLISFFSWVFGWYFPILFGGIIILAALWIIRVGGKAFGNYGGASLIVALISMLFITYILMYEPVKDYRPFAIGNNLIHKMHDGVNGKYESMLVYKNTKTGETKEYSSTSKEYENSKIWEKKEWKYVSMVQKAIVETKLPSITDFDPYIEFTEVGKDELKLEFIRALSSKSKMEGLKIQYTSDNSTMEIPLASYNLTDYPNETFRILDTIEMTNPSVTDIRLKDYILSSNDICIVSCQNIKKANWYNIDKLKEIQQGCLKNNIPFIMICTSGRKEINAFKKKYGFNIPIFVNDEKTLKAVSRSNPSLMVLQHAIVKGKYPHRAIPTFDWLNKEILNKK